MKRKLLAAGTLLLTLSILFLACNRSKLTPQAPAKNVNIVPESNARAVAENLNPDVFFDAANPGNHSPFKSTLNGHNKIKEHFVINDSWGNPALYIYNFENNAGFVFVSADYQLRPLLGFVERGQFRKDTVSAGYLMWLNRTLENIEVVRKGLYDNSKLADKAWRNYFSQNKTAQPSGFKMAPPPEDPCNPIPDPQTITSGPLLPVTWGQQCTYNEQCGDPAINYNCADVLSCSSRPVTGCVATSTSQIIRYWHPANNPHGYDYLNMPTTFGNGEVQRMMSDVGNAVGMSYGCASNGGSTAYSDHVPNALKNGFGFTTANYGGYSWSHTESNVFSGWPVLLDGCMTSNSHWFIINWYTSYCDCHEWVCDGAQATSSFFCSGGIIRETYLYFHMNWGWHEVFTGNDYNGWFGFDNWNIPGINWNFQYSNGETTEIHP
ncbi:MAG: C10 family peptidase [Bacteroidetes bacterium]|nr:C10 family peptidase [Bacteroidota bacterium]